jgi:hypothetical protein
MRGSIRSKEGRPELRCPCFSTYVDSVPDGKEQLRSARASRFLCASRFTHVRHPDSTSNSDVLHERHSYEELIAY